MQEHHEIQWLDYGPGTRGWYVVDEDGYTEEGPYESPEEAELIIEDLETEERIGQ